MMPTQLNGLRKTAILLVSLGDEQASRILSRLPAEAIPHIRREMETVGEVPDWKRREVVCEFCGAAEAEDYSEHQIALSTDDNFPPPFAKFINAQPVDVHRAISAEHPQTIAVVLTYLPRELACAVLAALPAAMQVEIIQRISCIQPPDERVVREIERAIESRVGPITTSLALPTQSALGRVLDEAEHRPPEDAASFDEILMLDSDELRAALEQINHETLALALTTAVEHLRRWIYDHVGRERAQLIHASMQFLGPVRISDVESAQQQILAAVRAAHES